MRDSVVMLDRHGDLEWWNSAATDMLGLQTAHDRGQHITNLLRDPRFISYFQCPEYGEPLTLTRPLMSGVFCSTKSPCMATTGAWLWRGILPACIA